VEGFIIAKTAAALNGNSWGRKAPPLLGSGGAVHSPVQWGNFVDSHVRVFLK